MRTDLLPHAALAVAYLVVVAGVLRRYRRGGDDRPSADVLRGASVVLFFGLVVHAGDALASGQSGRWWFASLPVLAAVFPSEAGSVLCRFTPRRTARDGEGQRDEVRARAAAERDRYNRLMGRVVALEDTFRRNTWIRQSGLAMRQLNELLTACETPTGDVPPAATAEMIGRST